MLSCTHLECNSLYLSERKCSAEQSRALKRPLYVQHDLTLYAFTVFGINKEHGLRVYISDIVYSRVVFEPASLILDNN
jgi:hypothetical protein